MKQERGHFASNLGIILATAGSAVGLGNIWRFPYMTGQDGGAAFILLYFACVLLLGIPGMVAEFVVGRHGAANAVRAYGRVGGNRWRWIGLLGVITSTIILGFYAVIAGWCMQYFFASIGNQIHGDTNAVAHYFKQFSSSPLPPVVWTVVFILCTHFVVIRGIRRGIERVSKVLMPLLFVLLLIIVVASCSLDGAMGGIDFLFHPHFDKLTSDVFLDALGQAFFSLSLGTACLCTYSSYFSRQTHLLKSATQIALVDTLIAILAGLMIFPAAFSVGVTPDAGPPLIFITLPSVFQDAFSSVPAVGYIISVLFYGLLVLAALTSTISMHEIGTAFYYEELHISRHAGAWIMTGICCALGVLCSLSQGAVDISVLGMDFLDFCDMLTSNFLLPLGSLATCIMVGWVVSQEVVKSEFTNWGTASQKSYRVWLVLVKFVCPIAIAAIFLHQLGAV
ncbi:MAG: sodium-dependent transporter [Prevotella sp.]|jgi:NSS family neurotransmitter:Na+ symporter